MILSKTQLSTDINAEATLTAPQKVILVNMVDSYEDIFPSVTTVQRDALTPADGQIVYNTDTSRYEYWNGVIWFGVGQDLSTPIVVKIDLSSADILALATTGIQVAAAPGAGYALSPTQVAYRLTYGSVPYVSGDIVLKNASLSTSDSFLSIAEAVIEAAADRSGTLIANNGTGANILKENDSLELKATAPPINGDSTLTVWVTYSLIPW